MNESRPEEIIDEKMREILKIAIIDDNEIHRRQLMLELEERNIQIVGDADTPESAIEVIAIQRPNLVLMELVMQEISGIDLAQYIHDNFHNVNVILYSGLNNEKVIIDVVGAGVGDFLEKPINIDHLCMAMKKIGQDIRNTD